MKKNTILNVLFSVLIISISTSANAQNKVIVIPSLTDAADISNVVTVAKSGGDFRDPVEAMESITEASFNNPYLIYIAPGVYTLSETLKLKAHVHISGAGRELTTLRAKTGTNMNSLIEDPGVDVDITIENIRLQNTQIGVNCVVIKSLSGIITIRNSTIQSYNCSRENVGIRGTVVITLENSYLFVSGGTSAIGVIGFDSNDVLNLINSEIRVFAEKNSNGTGVLLDRPFLKNSKIIVLGITNSTLLGIDMNNYLDTGFEIIDSEIEISSPVPGLITSGKAINMADVGPTIIRRSTISSPDIAISTDSDSPVTVSQSTIIGDVVGTQITCVFSDDGVGGELDNSCN